MKHDVAWSVICDKHGWNDNDCPADHWNELDKDEKRHLMDMFFVDFPDGLEADDVH